MVRVRRERCVNAVASMQRACRRGLDEVGRQHQRGHRAAADRRADIEAAADRLGGSPAERQAEAGARLIGDVGIAAEAAAAVDGRQLLLREARPVVLTTNGHHTGSASSREGVVQYGSYSVYAMN